MGFYINPPNQSKEEWLKQHYIKFSSIPPLFHKDEEGNIVVCLVQNPGFTAAAICFSKRELQEFQHPDDRRDKFWLHVPIKALIDLGAITEDAIK